MSNGSAREVNVSCRAGGDTLTSFDVELPESSLSWTVVVAVVMVSFGASAFVSVSYRPKDCGPLTWE